MSYPDGLIAWADLNAPDVDAAKVFYAGVLGWDAADIFAGDIRVYSMFSRDGKNVAGVGQQSPEMKAQGLPAIWTTYVNVADVDAVAAAFTVHGGTLFMEPMDVMESGRMAYGSDPTGAAIGFWQPKEHKGADDFNKPGFMTWNELVTDDLDAAVAFYTAVLPWTSAPMEGAPARYEVFSVGERQTGGAMPRPPGMPDEVPSHWMVYFWVDDTDAVVAKAGELGGAVAVPAFDTPMGRMAVISDPAGGTFSVIAPASAVQD